VLGSFNPTFIRWLLIRDHEARLDSSQAGGRLGACQHVERGADRCGHRANRGLGLEVARQCAVTATRCSWAAATRGGASGPPPGWSPTGCRTGGRARGTGRHRTPDGLGLPLALRISDQFGRVDVLVNNAAVHYDNAGQNAAKRPTWDVREALETNVARCLVTHAGLPPVLRRARHPRVVMVSNSEGGSLASMGRGIPAYHVSKAHSTR